MKLQFKIKDQYLLIHALRQNELPFESWEKLQNRIWEKFPRAFYLLSSHPEVIFSGKDYSKSFEEVLKELRLLIKESLESKEFKKLKRETEEYLTFVVKQWQKNEKNALSILEDLSGLEMPDIKVTVLITHPKLRNGIAVPTLNFIGWGHSEEWKNYSTVYLCHEIMHFLTKNTKIMHALIHLMVDNELRVRLNKKGNYFSHKKLGKDVPHYFKEIQDLEKKIYPFWKEYLKDRKGRNIIDLEKEINKEIKRHQ